MDIFQAYINMCEILHFIWQLFTVYVNRKNKYERGELGDIISRFVKNDKKEDLFIARGSTCGRLLYELYIRSTYHEVSLCSLFIMVTVI